jgi:DNA-binding NarL/FixJ family response regulator
MPMINVVIADDHNLVREGIQRLCSKKPRISRWWATRKTAKRRWSLVQQHRPDVLVMDIAMPGMNGIQVLEQLRERGLGTHVVILSMYADEVFVRQALQNGAKGYLLKGSFKEELLLTDPRRQPGRHLPQPLRVGIGADAAEQQQPIPRRPAHAARARAAPAHRQGAHQRRNRRSLMNVSIKTVERHRTNLMTKLDVPATLWS